MKRKTVSIYSSVSVLLENKTKVIMITGLPVTCAIDIMDSDEKGLYFLTAKGKDTLSCVAISVRGKVRELGTELLPHLFEKNSYMKEIGNEQEKMQGYEITHKCIGCKACQSVCPQNCIDFTIISAVIKQENCLHCGNCLSNCPQKAVVRRG